MAGSHWGWDLVDLYSCMEVLMGSFQLSPAYSWGCVGNQLEWALLRPALNIQPHAAAQEEYNNSTIKRLIQLRADSVLGVGSHTRQIHAGSGERRYHHATKAACSKTPDLRMHAEGFKMVGGPGVTLGEQASQMCMGCFHHYEECWGHRYGGS